MHAMLRCLAVHAAISPGGTTAVAAAVTRRAIVHRGASAIAAAAAATLLLPPPHTFLLPAEAADAPQSPPPLLSMPPPPPPPPPVEYPFYTDVNAASCFRLVDAIDDAARDGRDVHLHVQSSGGDVLPALYASDRIRAASHVDTFVDGFCASAATLLTVAGRRRSMTAHSMLLVHEIRSAFAMEPLSSLEADARNLRAMESAVVDIYAECTALSRAQIKTLMQQERWITAKEALALGFVDAIL